MPQKREQHGYAAIFAVVLAFLTYMVSMKELQNNLSDYAGHVYTYIPLLQGAQGLDGWMAVPYFMWHLCVILLESCTPIPLEAASALISSLFAVFSFYVLYWMFTCISRKYGWKMHSVYAGSLSFGLSIIQPVIMYWFDTENQYLGQFSTNPMHNPTHMCVKPFSLLCLCLTYDILEKYQNQEHTGVFVNVSNGLKKAYTSLSVLLLLSCMAKPTFAEMFIPTVGFIMLYTWLIMVIRKEPTAKAYFQKCLTMLLVSVPALIYILIQFLAYFIFGGSYGGDGGGVIITGWMQVWKLYSENVTASIVLGMGFPLFMVAFNGSYFLKDTLGRLALVGYIVGVLECALLGESGGKITHGDFLWPMMSGMTLLWVVSTIRLAVLEQTQNKSRLQQICLQAAWFLFYLFVLFGIIYLWNALHM